MYREGGLADVGHPADGVDPDQRARVLQHLGQAGQFLLPAGEAGDIPGQRPGGHRRPRFNSLVWTWRRFPRQALWLVDANAPLHRLHGRAGHGRVSPVRIRTGLAAPCGQEISTDLTLQAERGRQGFQRTAERPGAGAALQIADRLRA